MSLKKNHLMDQSVSIQLKILLKATLRFKNYDLQKEDFNNLF